MVKLTVKDIEVFSGGKIVSGDTAAIVPFFSTDTRNIIPGSTFIAIKGKNFDGRDYVREALAKGAAGAIVESGAGLEGVGKDKHLVVVDDATEAMGSLAARIRSHVDIPVMYITDTNRKTTTKEILSHILSSKFKVLKSKKSFNNIIGLSLTLFDLDPSHEVAVLEIGTNHPGEVPKLASIARPHMAIITNIGDGHLEFFGDRNGVFIEKTSLLDLLPPSGMAFLNKDDELLSGVAKTDDGKKFYGKGEGADFGIGDLDRRADGYGFSVNGREFFVPLEGEHNVYNATAAIAAAEYFGLTPEEIKESLSKVSLPEMRLEKVRSGDVVFINDSYNANPNSFECALKVLEKDPFASKKGVVAGDMMELGAKTEEFHRTLGMSIAEKGIDFLITIGPNARHMIDGAVRSGMGKDRVVEAEDYRSAADMVRRFSGPDTVVLLKGSRSSRMEEVLKCFTTFCTR